jgi:8-oxo-dGTP pyrophosphatase MutT (NUDIX family)
MADSKSSSLKSAPKKASRSKAVRPEQRSRAEDGSKSVRAQAGATSQVAALPVRRGPDGSVEVLLVTSRDTGRWVIPKGWTSKRLKDRDAAAREAMQEAGVAGKIANKPIGQYRYRKLIAGHARLLDVSVFLLRVRKEKKRWREKDQRQRSWFPARIAARRVREAQLKALIIAIDKA